jgi:hypothetical protein
MIPSWWLRCSTGRIDIDIARSAEVLKERKLWEERMIEEASAFDREKEQ